MTRMAATGRIIPARVSNEKEDALCPESPTNVHFLQLHYDSEGTVIPVARFACEACGKPVKQRGARWVIDRYIISEVDDIQDLL